MSTVIANMSMSLDGFIEDGAGDANRHLFGWTQSGPQEWTLPGDGRPFHTSGASAEHMRSVLSELGALICGRSLFDLTHGWGGRHPAGAPVFVVTHQAPADWPHPDAPFTFVTEGVAAAVEQARAVAGPGTVAVASADIARQCLGLGLLDVVAVDLVPVLLGTGKPWFAGLADPVELKDPVIVAGEGVTHLVYGVRGR